jgi:hypothetical protein
MSDYRVIVCGGREPLGDVSVMLVRVILKGLAETFRRQLVVVDGGARGVDRMVDGMARSLGLRVETFPADWDGRGRIAGFERNQRMLDSGAELVIAIKHPFNWKLDKGGTEDMVKRATRAGVPTFVIEGPV